MRVFKYLVKKMSKKSKEVEVIKVEVPTWLTEEFRNYVAQKYGLEGLTIENTNKPHDKGARY